MASKHDESSPLLRPIPQRTWQITPASTEPSTPPTPAADSQLDESKAVPPNRTRSILNLTSSTLFGIYADPKSEGYPEFSQPSTPWGTGSMTPAMVPSSPTSDDRKPPSIRTWERSGLQRAPGSHHKTTVRGTLIRSVVLFVLGLAYGTVATQLHEKTQLVPIKIDGLNRYSWRYTTFWGMAGIVLGNLLPWVDEAWRESTGYKTSQKQNGRTKGPEGTDLDETDHADESGERSTDWNTVVRGVGAFVGIAFAIKKLPWESTLQASLTLALANPVLWYLVDGTVPGFALSSLVGLGGTALALGVNPGWVPTPTLVGNSTYTASSMAELGGLVSYEGISVFTWIASVLFCSCVCFGNVGRVLAPGSSKKGYV